jgi:hypothetical protein
MRGLTLTEVHGLSGRRGVVVPYRTPHRYATTGLGLTSAIGIVGEHPEPAGDTPERPFG